MKYNFSFIIIIIEKNNSSSLTAIFYIIFYRENNLLLHTVLIYYLQYITIEKQHKDLISTNTHGQQINRSKIRYIIRDYGTAQYNCNCVSLGVLYKLIKLIFNIECRGVHLLQISKIHLISGLIICTSDNKHDCELG